MADEKPLFGMDEMFAGDEPASETPPPAATPNVTEAPASETPAPAQPRDESGRFAPKAETPAAEPTPQTEPAKVQSQKPLIDPEQFKGYLEEREKRQALEKRIADFEARERQREEQQRQQSQIPSPQDEQAYNAYVATQIERAQWLATANTSQQFAIRDFGKESVEEAVRWAQAQQDPLLDAQVRRQGDPFGWLVQHHRAQQLTQKIGSKSFEDAAREWAIANGFAPATQTEPQPQAASPNPASAQAPAASPTRSLASAPTAGGIQTFPTSEFAAIEQMFNR